MEEISPMWKNVDGSKSLNPYIESYVLADARGDCSDSTFFVVFFVLFVC